MTRLLYLIALLPYLTDLLETGRQPSTPRELMTELVLSPLLLLFAWAVNRQAAELVRSAHTDDLTQLHNLKRFREDLRREIGRDRRQGSPLSLAFLDLDNFKAINDLHGHSSGDRVLKDFAALLRDCVRKDVDSCYRLGGDEFAVLLPGAHREEAQRVVDSVCSQAAEPPVALASYGAGVSAGVAELGKAEDAHSLLHRADALMYEVKARTKRKR